MLRGALCGATWRGGQRAPNRCVLLREKFSALNKGRKLEA